ncbi:DNA polymerase III subunit chi [Psychrobacter frigidicola]|uniref:DNA polymerase III subunit chi n=1 Tax=Psychrobacter frigidicola TaxID=45611 RepID=A0A5C7A0A5_9GAMM|nr:DNA polymerase III subunit chi [Psychrobacter frigidicola]TXD96814.1 DNA polymerase III subunit chi [Psychrobacter frigidicola]
MQISFYVLSNSKAQDILGFICQLTQTALNKSSQSLLILADDEMLLGELDEALWAQNATSFIPHQRLIDDKSDRSTDDAEAIDTETEVIIKEQPLAPVLLSTYMPEAFKGIVINTTARPVNDFMSATNYAQPTRVLEIIKPDTTSVQEGRDKYKHYQNLNYELTHFKV